MAMRNYRQAKRNREETKKKKQQEKLQRKQDRATTPDAVPETPASDVDNDPKSVP
jgi:hypothetical protein